jgi:hypothetical protein
LSCNAVWWIYSKTKENPHLRRENTARRSLKAKCKEAGWDNDFLLKVLTR